MGRVRIHKSFIGKVVIVTFGLMFAVASPAFALVGPHSHTDGDGEVFLGGDYIELGISKLGNFGTDNSDPISDFHAAADENNAIGMTTNPSGFGVSPDLTMDYFLPGSPEERWVVGYTEGSTQTHGSNSLLNGASDISDNVVTNQSSGDNLQAQSVGTFNNKLKITQLYSFSSGDKFFKNEVTLKNVGNTSLDHVRYMRTFDPDNTVDQSGDYTTHNYIPFQQPGDGKAVVIADTNIGGTRLTRYSRRMVRIRQFCSIVPMREHGFRRAVSGTKIRMRMMYMTAAQMTYIRTRSQKVIA